jgi:hypothetical protein
MHKVLGLIPNTAKRKRKRQGEEDKISRTTEQIIHQKGYPNASQT